MEHNMHLYQSPFEKIKNGSKTIEIRLNDEKRRKISVGDYIKFTKLPNEDEQILVKVIALYPYATFEELYAAYDFSEFGCERGLDGKRPPINYKFGRVNGIENLIVSGA